MFDMKLGNWRVSILDKYIIGKYLSTFGFIILIFTLISCVIDYSEKADAFSKPGVTKHEIFIDYFMHFIPHIAVLLFPLYALIAVIFFTSRMAYNSEVISMLNAGISFGRFLRPYLMASGMVALVHLVFIHYIVPSGNKERLRIEHKYVATNQDKGKTDNVHMFIDPETEIYIQRYNKSDTSARDFRIIKYKGKEMVGFLKAGTAKWGGYPNKWKLQNCERHTFDGLTETIQTNILVIDTTVNVHPEDFVEFTNQNEMLTTAELQKRIIVQQERGVGNTRIYQIEKHRRTSEPFSIIILTIIGAALAARKVRGGMGLHLALGIGLGALFIFLSKFSATFALQPGVPPVVGVWIPNLVFGCVAVYLVSRAQK